jgi:hypothetical protein
MKCLDYEKELFNVREDKLSNSSVYYKEYEGEI